jgi:hypothetical protein
LDHEVFWEALQIAPHRLEQHFGGDAVESSEFGIEQHPLAAQEKDRAGDVLGRPGGGVLGLGHVSARFRQERFDRARLLQAGKTSKCAQISIYALIL